MPAVTRLGDKCSGHGGWPARVNDSASGDVFVNNIGVHRQDDHWVVHCDPHPVCHDSTLQSGSGTVFVNNKQCGRVGDPVACGSVVAEGSSNVFAG
jgi:uncharacterized Zn-binding protein involved in type VI secretion